MDKDNTTSITIPKHYWQSLNRYHRFWFSMPIMILLLFSPLSIAQDNNTALKKRHYQPRSTIIVYSDGSADHLRELANFTELLPLAARPEIIDGKQLAKPLPANMIAKATLAYFGRSSRDQAAWQTLPEPLREMIAQMQDYEGITPEELHLPYPTTGIWRYGDNRQTTEKILTVFTRFDPRDKSLDCRVSGYLLSLGLQHDYCDYHLETRD